MRTVPQAGEVWFIDLGMIGKPRYSLVLAAQSDARLALASVVLITTQFEDTPYFYFVRLGAVFFAAFLAWDFEAASRCLCRLTRSATTSSSLPPRRGK
jgi:mRNA-degrading endonuclease toxin of MazEF toxin-antitoxin module